MKKKVTVAVILFALVGLTTWQLIVNKQTINKAKNSQQSQEIAIPVNTVKVEKRSIEINILKTGNLAPFKEVNILSTTSGILTKMNIELGDVVREGKIIATIDSNTKQLELQKSELNEQKLKHDLNTYNELLAGKAATQEKVNELTLSYNNAVNQSQQLRKQIEDAMIKSPTNGIVSNILQEEGVYVNAGTQLATIVNLTKAKVEVYLSEIEVYQVKEQQTVIISSDVYPGKTFNGNVTFISPQADATHNYLTEIIMDNNSETPLRSGTFIYADFSRKTNESVLVIPRRALVDSKKEATVFVVDSSNHVKLIAVTTGRDINDMIEITSGLNLNDMVVTSGQINLKDGASINVSNQNILQ